MNASASDLRLWLTPTVVVIETVKRLAASVNTNSTSHDSKPALVSSGSRTVDISPEQTSNDPSARMLIESARLFQFRFVLIVGCPYRGWQSALVKPDLVLCEIGTAN